MVIRTLILQNVTLGIIWSSLDAHHILVALCLTKLNLENMVSCCDIIVQKLVLQVIITVVNSIQTWGLVSD